MCSRFRASNVSLLEVIFSWSSSQEEKLSATAKGHRSLRRKNLIKLNARYYAHPRPISWKIELLLKGFLSERSCRRAISPKVNSLVGAKATVLFSRARKIVFEGSKDWGPLTTGGAPMVPRLRMYTDKPAMKQNKVSEIPSAPLMTLPAPAQHMWHWSVRSSERNHKCSHLEVRSEEPIQERWKYNVFLSFGWTNPCTGRRTADGSTPWPPGKTDEKNRLPVRKTTSIISSSR